MEIDKNNPAVQILMRKFADFISDYAETMVIHGHRTGNPSLALYPQLVLVPGNEPNLFYCQIGVRGKEVQDPIAFYQYLRAQAQEVREQLV